MTDLRPGRDRLAQAATASGPAPLPAKNMVVQALWPGATVRDTLEQVTERLERKLQETPDLDYLRSYTTPGQTTIFVHLQGAAPARAVPDIW